jgi:predicted HTH transcriptional regulator
MMQIVNKKILEKENEHLAFLPNTDDFLEVAKIISAFSNSEGGILMSGVKSNGKILGIFPEQELQKLEIVCQEWCIPAIKVTTFVRVLGFRKILEINIEKAVLKPIQIVVNQKERIAYVRSDAFNVPSNKIQTNVWKCEEVFSKRNLTLCKEEKTILNFIQERKGISVSQIRKNLDFPIKELDNFLSFLLYLGSIRLKYANGSWLLFANEKSR